MSDRIPYEHLLGREWADMNCAAAVRVAINGWLAQQGDERHVAREDLPESEDDAQASLAALAAGRSSCWAFRTFDATEAHVGDLILSHGPRGPHVALAVGGGVALSSTQESGVRAVGLQFLAGVLGVYRLR